MLIKRIYNEDVRQSAVRLTLRATTPAIATVLTAILALAFSVYFTFGENIKDNFLLSYPGRLYVVRLALLANTGSVMTSCPLTLHPARQAAITALQRTLPTLIKPAIAHSNEQHFETCIWRIATVA
eukprot:scaffold218489_cov34-Prasinocladus_malaysianus.AAC.1